MQENLGYRFFFECTPVRGRQHTVSS